MKIVLQKVSRAWVDIDGDTVAEIADGFLVLLGVAQEDTQQDADWLVEKIVKLRVFPDGESDSFMEQNIDQAGGAFLVVSQFTLFGDCRKGTRPSFSKAARPEKAKELYAYVVEQLQQKGFRVEIGAFGEHMEVGLINDGPMTLVIDTAEQK